MSDVRLALPTKAQDLWFTVLRWFDSWAGLEYMKTDGVPKMDWVRCIPSLLPMRCAWASSGWEPAGPPWRSAVAFYFVRMFAITGWYHRYFSHRTFKTSRTVQFAFAVLGGACAQRGPLWWAGHHRHHHVASDSIDDVHSPRQGGFSGPT